MRRLAQYGKIIKRDGRIIERFIVDLETMGSCVLPVVECLKNGEFEIVSTDSDHGDY